MNILLIAVHYPVASGRYYARAFRRLGHDVRTLGPTTGAEIWGISVEPRHAWQPDVQIEPRENWLPDTRALDLLGGWSPDLIITCDSAYTMLGKSAAPHICVGVDNHVRDYRHLRDFDAMFLCHTFGNRMGEPNVHWLPPGYDPEAHRDLGLERDIDIGIMAVGYQDRADMVAEFGRAGIPVAAGTGLLWDEYEQFYNRCKIALVKSIMGDLTQRFLETMAMGCCVLADETVDAGRLGFMPGVHYVAYASAADAIDKARALLASRHRLGRIAAMGQAFVLPHTWDRRAAEVLRAMEMQ